MAQVLASTPQETKTILHPKPQAQKILKSLNTEKTDKQKFEKLRKNIPP
jgi:hypothetical protein